MGMNAPSHSFYHLCTPESIEMEVCIHFSHGIFTCTRENERTNGYLTL